MKTHETTVYVAIFVGMACFIAGVAASNSAAAQAIRDKDQWKALAAECERGLDMCGRKLIPTWDADLAKERP